MTRALRRLTKDDASYGTFWHHFVNRSINNLASKLNFNWKKSEYLPFIRMEPGKMTSRCDLVSYSELLSDPCAIVNEL